MQYDLYPRIQWLLMMYEVGASRVERIEQKCCVRSEVVKTDRKHQ